MMTDVSLLGTGLLGAPAARRLHETGLSVTVWNRSPGRLEPLRAAGLRAAKDPGYAVAASPVTILFLSDFRAIREVLLTEPARGRLAGKTVIQMGTIAPEESRGLAGEVAEAGGDFLEAPVLGSVPQALSGTLAVLVGGTSSQFDAWRPLLARLGIEPHLVGPVGKAAALKLALNGLIGSLTTAFAASVALVRAEGVDVELLMEILRKSALYAPTFDKKLPRILEDDYSGPTFPVKHLLKDMRLVAAAEERNGIDAGMARHVASVLERTISSGFGEEDYSALARTVARPGGERKG